MSEKTAFCVTVKCGSKLPSTKEEMIAAFKEILTGDDPAAELQDQINRLDPAQFSPRPSRRLLTDEDVWIDFLNASKRIKTWC